MRKFYSEYVKHCARFFFTRDFPPSSVENRVDYNNYVSVSNVLSRYDARFVNIVRLAYTSPTIQEAVNEYSVKNNCTREELWYIIQKFEKEVAIERGLL